MRARERLSCAVGNVFNDIYTQLLFSFEIVFFMKVLERSASQAGLIVLIGEISEALISLITGYLGDYINVPFLSNKIGRRKSWHLLATFVMAISIPLLFNKCFLCRDGIDQSWLSLVYFGFFSALVNICFNMVEINHLAFVTNVAENVSEFTALIAIRTMFSFLSGVYVYVIAWALLGQDSGKNLGPTHLSDFAHLSWIATGTGVLFATIFYIGTKEPRKTRQRKPSAYIDMNVSGLFMVALEKENQNDSRKTSLVHSIVDLFVTSSNETPHQEEKGYQDTEDHENRQRKRSLLQNFVEVLFYDEEVETDQSPSQTETDKSSQEGPQSEDRRKQMVLELQKLDRDRKKSLLVRVIDGLLSRSDNSQQEEMSTENIEDHVAVDVANDKYTTGENCWRQESLQDNQRKDYRENNQEVESVDREIEIDEEDKPTLFSAKCRKRKTGIVSVPSEGRPGLFNLGFENEVIEEIEEECSSDTSDLRKQKRSVTFSLPKSAVVPLRNGDGENNVKVDASDQKLPTATKETESVDDVCNHSGSEDKQEVLASPAHPAKKRRPKTMKHWLRDLTLYKVAIIFTCSRLARNAVYTYLPLFLTERLLFSKEAIAFFPLVLMISAAFSSIFCEKFNQKFGSKWSYLLAAFLVIGSVVWNYFQTPCIRQATYAPVIIMGIGLSVMYVMALAFITDLIGENKDSSGLVISIITVIARVSSGSLVIGIQSFYPEDPNSDKAISNYVQHVFVMAPGILTLVGSLLVFSLQPSVLACKTKELKEDTGVQGNEDKSSADEVTSHVSSNHTATPNVS